MRSFTWERGPFENCAKCGEKSFGLLNAGGDSMHLRCSNCRHSAHVILPALDKRVVYLDQFVFSELFKIKMGWRRTDKHTGFWDQLLKQITRVVLLQQAIFPHSDIHHNEGIVSKWPKELLESYEGIGGDISFHDTNEIEHEQVFEFAHAFIEDRDPQLTFEVDAALEGERNDWLADMRISVNSDYSQFAGGYRQSIKRSAASLEGLMARWRTKDMGFDEVLEQELTAFGASRIEAVRDAGERFISAIEANDLMGQMDALHGPVPQELENVRAIFSEAGVSEEQMQAEIHRFLSWPRHREQPFARVLAYMFAGLAGQVKAGRKKPASGGFFNDVRAIAAYAPYVDAIFVDKECAEILGSGRTRDELAFRARVFSLNTREEFLAYLSGIEAQASDEVRKYACRIYGVV